MNNNDRALLKLSLGIISGRIEVGHLSAEDYYDLGFESWQFERDQLPTLTSIKYKAEDLLVSIIHAYTENV